MRRAFLLAGIAAGAVLVFTTAATVPLTRNAKLSRHMEKVQDVAFCRIGYEIASSFPSYASRSAFTPAARLELISQSDKLNDQQEILGELLRGTFKTKAAELGMDEFSYENILAKFEADAELEAVMSLQSSKGPTDFLDQLEERCAPYLTE